MISYQWDVVVCNVDPSKFVWVDLMRQNAVKFPSREVSNVTRTFCLSPFSSAVRCSCALLLSSKLFVNFSAAASSVLHQPTISMSCWTSCSSSTFHSSPSLVPEVMTRTSVYLWLPWSWLVKRAWGLDNSVTTRKQGLSFGFVRSDWEWMTR